MNGLPRLGLCLVATLAVAAAPGDASWRAAGWVEGFEAGLAEARRLDRPAFVYFDAEWCTWCQRYKRDTLAAPAVQERLARGFVPVLVGYDARPDLMERFGGQGLPFTVVASPDGAPLEAFVGILAPGDLAERLDELRRREAAPPRRAPVVLARVRALDAAGLARFREAFLEHVDGLYDPEVGTLVGRFPTGATIKRASPLTWMYLMDRGLWPERTRRAAAAERARLLDPVDGGFFNFQDPSRGDFLETSKLLEANAWMSAWQLRRGRRRPAARVAGLSGLYFLEETLWDRTRGGFYQAQIADADYYRLPPAERLAATPPPVDRIKRADTNAQAAWALVEMGRALGREGPIERADRTLEAVTALFVHEGAVHHMRRDGAPVAEGLPRDWFWLLAAGAAADRARPQARWPQRLAPVARTAGEWLDARMTARDEELPPELAGLVAWAGLEAERYPALPPEAVPWALRQLRIEAETRPDEIVVGLRAWQRALAAGRVPAGSE